MKKKAPIGALIAIFIAIIVATQGSSNKAPETNLDPRIDPNYQEMYIDPLNDLIILESPKLGDVIESPLVIKGMARGQYFFEATFPIMLTNWDGLIIAEHYAQATEPWMTTDFVPFEAVLEFEKPEYGERGTLILKNHNASGLPEHDVALEIPVFFE